MSDGDPANGRVTTLVFTFHGDAMFVTTLVTSEAGTKALRPAFDKALGTWEWAK